MPSQKRLKELEEQLAHVRWLKVNNGRKILQSLRQTKAIKQNDEIVEISTNHSSERSSWVQSVVKSELERPLVISDGEIHRLYEEDLLAKRRAEDVSFTRNTQPVVYLS
jgi:hypothetical protein